MKKCAALLVFMVFLFIELAAAHPGKMRKDGGHCDHKKKEYHYHKKGIGVTGASKSKYDKLCKTTKKKRTYKKSKKSSQSKRRTKKKSSRKK